MAPLDACADGQRESLKDSTFEGTWPSVGLAGKAVLSLLTTPGTSSATTGRSVLYSSREVQI